MNQMSIMVNKILNASMMILAFVFLVLDNYRSLWMCMLFCGAFALLTIIQYALIRGSKKRTVRSLMVFTKFGMSLGSALLFTGMGPSLLFCLVEFDICLAYPPLLSGILSAAGIGAILAFSGESRDMILIKIVLAGMIYLLAYVVKKEEDLARSTAEMISSLRVSEKKLRDNSRQIELFNDRLADAARMQERSRITKGIHDTLGHMLTAIVVQLSAALQKLGQDDEAAKECVKIARDQAKSGLESVRETIQLLDDAGTSFYAKLKRAIEAAEKSMQIQVMAVLESEVEPCGSMQQLLLSCLKEGLTNGVRHGHAAAFVIKLEKAGGLISFYIEDNGAGCDKLTKGFGLIAMEEAVEQAGGTLNASGMLDEGFYLRIVLPDADENGA